MSVWSLVDCRKPLEEDEDNPRQSINSEVQLRQELQRLRRQSPALVFLKKPGGEGLQIAIGGPYAGVTWLPPDSVERRVGACVAITYQPGSPEDVEFSAEGIPTPLGPEELLPAEEVIEAALYYYREGRRPEWLTWRHWNPATKQWDTIPSSGPAPAGALAK